MAKVKIKGINDLVLISEEEAKYLSDAKANERNPKTKIRFKNYEISVEDIGIIIHDEKEPGGNSRFKNNNDDYYEWRRMFAALPAGEKAKRIGWANFSLFYEGIYGNPPIKIEWKERAIDHAARHFTDERERCHPNPLIWYELLNIPKGSRMCGLHLTVIESIERNERQEIFRDRKYWENREKAGECVGTVNDLPF